MRTSWGDLVRAKLGMTAKDMFTPREAAQLLGISATKAWKDICGGMLPATDLNGGNSKIKCWRVTKADIGEYVARVEDRA